MYLGNDIYFTLFCITFHCVASGFTIIDEAIYKLSGLSYHYMQAYTVASKAPSIYCKEILKKMHGKGKRNPFFSL